MANKKNQNLNQLAKINGKDKLIEFNDYLDLNTFNLDRGPDALTATLHSSTSKINIKICDYSKDTITCEHNIDANKFRGMCSLAINNPKMLAGFKEEKINPYSKDKEGRSPVCKLTINYDPSRNLPWYIAMENGTGICDNSQTGGIKIKPGSYKKEKATYINLTHLDFVSMAEKIYNYINSFELVHFKEYEHFREKCRKTLSENRK